MLSIGEGFDEAYAEECATIVILLPMKGVIRYSVVIPTYNRGPGLAECLESIVAQTTHDFEVIVVDDCSRSETEARNIVEKIRDENPEISFKFIRQKENGGHGKARNAGVQIARGSIILFTDDDCIVPRNWIEAHVDAHQRYSEAAGVGGWYWEPETHTKSVYDRFLELQYEYSYERSQDCELWTNTMYSSSGNTANMSYKTRVFRALGGFDEKIYFTGGIDWELKAHCIAEGHSLVSIPLSVQHVKGFTFSSFFKKTVKLGRGLDYIASKYPGQMRPSLNSALHLYTKWKASPITEGRLAYMAFFWSIALIPGKWINRIIDFKPTEIYEMRSLKYFTYRFKDGKRITTHELLPFDPTLSKAAFTKSSAEISALPRYSVIIPTYNRREYLMVAIQSALDQEDIPASHYEIIIVDDGSTDGTKESVQEMIRLHSGRALVYHYQENQGASPARNAGAARARGEILFFTDSDCRVPKKWLWTKLQAYHQHPDIVGTSGGQLTRRTGATRLDFFRSSSPDNRFVSTYARSMIKTNDTTNGFAAYDSASMSVRADVFRRVGGFFPIGTTEVGFYHEDVDFVCRIQNNAGPMALVPGTYALNRRLLSLQDFRKVAFVRGATLPFLIERIYPHGTLVREKPIRIVLYVNFLQCLMHPFTIFEWIALINFQSYAAGYRKGIRVFQQLNKKTSQ